MKQREVCTLAPLLFKNITGYLSSFADSQHISNEEVSNRAGLAVPLADIISCRRLHWLGHVARMSDDRLLKQLLFGWLPQSRPAHGAKLHWCDIRSGEI